MTPTEKAQKKLELKSNMYKRVFADSMEGAVILEQLNRMYDPLDLFDPDPHVSAFKMGQRDVIKYINSLVEYKAKEEK